MIVRFVRRGTPDRSDSRCSSGIEATRKWCGYEGLRQSGQIFEQLGPGRGKAGCHGTQFDPCAANGRGNGPPASCRNRIEKSNGRTGKIPPLAPRPPGLFNSGSPNNAVCRAAYSSKIPSQSRAATRAQLFGHARRRAIFLNLGFDFLTAFCWRSWNRCRGAP